MTKTHKDVVWPVAVPPVCTARWDDNSWMNWADNCRPADYNESKFDNEAWQAYVYEKQRQEIQKAWPSFDIVHVGGGQFTFKKKEG